MTSGCYEIRAATEAHTDLRTGAVRNISYGYTFHPNGSIASRTVSRALPGGGASTIVATYDTAGNRLSVTNALLHQVSWSNYNGLGQPGRMTDANGVVTDFSYQPNGDLASATTTLPNGSRVV